MSSGGRGAARVRGWTSQWGSPGSRATERRVTVGSRVGVEDLVCVLTGVHAIRTVSFFIIGATFAKRFLFRGLMSREKSKEVKMWGNFCG